MRKTIPILLIIALLLPLLFINPNGFFSHGLEIRDTYENNRVILESIKHIVPESQWKNVKGFELNAALYVDKGILVYGNYSMIQGNDFGNHINFPAQQGYYIKDGKRGEYRYHGFDYQGNKYANNDFRRDADSGRSGSEKNWIYRPFFDYAGRSRLADISDYSRWATEGHLTNPEITIKTQQWINRIIDFDINSKFNSSKNGYDYIHIQTPSGTRTTGEGKMWHQNPDSKIWYQTFSIPRQKHEDKILLPTEAKVTVLNKPEELKFKKDQETLTLRVRVDGIYQDQGKNHTEQLRTIYYTGYDIDQWEISLMATAQAKQTVKVGNATLSKGYAEFDVVVQRNQVLSNPVIELVSSTKAIFSNKESSGLAEKHQPVTVEADGKSLASIFTVSSHITLANGNQFNKSQINFRDASIGKIIKYEYYVDYIGGMDTTTFQFNTDKVNDADVEQKLYEFIFPKINNKTSGEYKFEITQTVTGTSGMTDSYKQILVILLVEPEIVVVAPKIEVDLPEKWFDIVPLPVYDSSENVSSRKVYVDGVEVNSDTFFNGQFTFGESDIDRLVPVEVEYEIEGFKSKMSGVEPEFKIVKWIYVYSTKPRAQFKFEGNYKQNRKQTATDTSNSANAEFLLSHYPITSYNWKFTSNGGDITSLRTKNISDAYKEFIFKQPGGYSIELTVSNGLGRVSDPYRVDIYIHEDYEPAVILNLWNNALARGEEMSFFHDVVSTDGDIISKNIIMLYYDNNNNGNPTELIGTYQAADFVSYTPTKLGNYKVVNIVEEEFGEETIPEFITAEDKVKKVIEREFFVDNYRPLTEMYIDVPLNLPEIDVYFMLDENLPREKNDYVVSERMNINNYLRTKNIRPKVETWNMHTYVYTQPASTVRYTGNSYPPATTNYTSGDYSGTLNRTSVTNNPYSVDEGWYTTVYDTVTRTEREWTDISYPVGSSHPGPGSGWIPGGGYTSGGWVYQSFYRDRTITEQVPRQVWVHNWVSYNDYTGHYSGTIYKYVRQPYTNPFRTLSEKYIIYISDNNISQLNDLQMVLSKADARVILIGQNSIKNQLPHEHFILNNKPIGELVNDALDYIADSNPYVQQYLVEAGVDTFNITAANYDDESDTIIQQGFQYVQNQNYFDTPLGKESYAVTAYSDDTWITTTPTKFNTTGKFEIYRRIKDRPSTDPNFVDFSYTSNIPLITVYSHRRPIALATLDWDYDAVKSVYKTTWVDQSFDWDHINSRFDKGIVERKIRYRRNGGEWIYRIPDELIAGTYELEYYVKDPENTWSDVFTMNFTLNPAPPMQLDAKARALLYNKFAISSIPASESLQLYDVWTRYPYNVRLEVAMFQGTTQRTTTQVINYSAATGAKVGNDINWNNITHNIPATLPDGNYTLRITAVGDGGQTAQKNFPVTVRTPINLVPNIEDQWITTDYTNLRGQTTKYANTVTAQLYRGHAFTTMVTLTGAQTADLKNWVRAYFVPGTIPNGDYVARFTATTPNGNTEYVDVAYRVDSLRISGYLMPNPAMAGDQIIFTIETEGNAERIEIMVDPEIIAKDQRVQMGYPQQQYPMSFTVDGTVRNKTDIFTYTLWVTTDETLDKNNNRLRVPYRFTVRAWKGTVFRDLELELDVRGNVLQLIKPGIKDKNDK